MAFIVCASWVCALAPIDALARDPDTGNISSIQAQPESSKRRHWDTRYFLNSPVPALIDHVIKPAVGESKVDKYDLEKLQEAAGKKWDAILAVDFNHFYLMLRDPRDTPARGFVRVDGLMDSRPIVQSGQSQIPEGIFLGIEGISDADLIQAVSQANQPGTYLNCAQAAHRILDSIGVRFDGLPSDFPTEELASRHLIPAMIEGAVLYRGNLARSGVYGTGTHRDWGDYLEKADTFSRALHDLNQLSAWGRAGYVARIAGRGCLERFADWLSASRGR
jgi:hypothetical protein